MSHISGEDVVSGDPGAISNLLEVFSGLMDYILEKIGSDNGSTDNEGHSLLCACYFYFHQIDIFFLNLISISLFGPINVVEYTQFITVLVTTSNC